MEEFMTQPVQLWQMIVGMAVLVFVRFLFAWSDKSDNGYWADIFNLRLAEIREDLETRHSWQSDKISNVSNRVSEVDAYAERQAKRLTGDVDALTERMDTYERFNDELFSDVASVQRDVEELKVSWLKRKVRAWLLGD